MILHLLLLRANQQEVEDDENQNQRQHLHDNRRRAARILGIGGADAKKSFHGPAFLICDDGAETSARPLSVNSNPAYSARPWIILRYSPP